MSEATNCKQQQLSSETCLYVLAFVRGAGDTAVMGPATVQALTETIFWGTREAMSSPHPALNRPDPMEILCPALASSLQWGH